MTQTVDPATQPQAEQTLGELGYAAYQHARGGLTFDGKPAPAWGEMPGDIQLGWAASAQAVAEQVAEQCERQARADALGILSGVLGRFDPTSPEAQALRAVAEEFGVAGDLPQPYTEQDDEQLLTVKVGISTVAAVDESGETEYTFDQYVLLLWADGQPVPLFFGSALEVVAFAQRQGLRLNWGAEAATAYREELGELAGLFPSLSLSHSA